MSDADRYAITVKKVTVEDETLWRATVRELPDVAEFADTRDEAYELAIDAIVHLKQAAVEEGREFPEPAEDDDEEYSGRVTLRMPAHLHRSIAEKARADDMSLNAYIVTTLSVDLAQRIRAVSSIGTARNRIIETKAAGLEASLARAISAVGSATLTTGAFYYGSIHRTPGMAFGSQYYSEPVYRSTAIAPRGQVIFVQEDAEKDLRVRVG